MMRWLKAAGYAPLRCANPPYTALLFCVLPGLALADAPVPVKAVTLRPAVWRASVTLAASVAASQSAALAAARPGRVIAVLYTSGESVPEGAVLVKLDDAPEQAQFALDDAKRRQADSALARAQKLMSIAGASRAALEQAQADSAEAKAQVQYDQAVLSQLKITAPFAGTLGIRDIAAGDYVQQGQVVAHLTQAAPLRVLFSIPQTEAAGIAIGDSFTLAAASTVAGKITALSPEIDFTTNARDAEGVITGPPGALLPGMVGTVTLAEGEAQPAFAVPPAALNDSALGPFLFVLAPAGAGAYTLHTVYVTKLGDAGDQTFVGTDGLQAGEEVLAIGGFKLTDGASVSLQSP
jgi:RND family efflux transporter MFP subunit